MGTRLESSEQSCLNANRTFLFSSTHKKVVFHFFCFSATFTYIPYQVQQQYSEVTTAFTDYVMEKNRQSGARFS